VHHFGLRRQTHSRLSPILPYEDFPVFASQSAEQFMLGCLYLRIGADCLLKERIYPFQGVRSILWHAMICIVDRLQQIIEGWGFHRKSSKYRPHVRCAFVDATSLSYFPAIQYLTGLAKGHNHTFFLRLILFLVVPKLFCHE
jgi:hypothetical protein